MVRDEPTRSISPDSRTRSSLACCRRGTLPISSRNIVPPSASSKRPMRSVRASVNAPLTWPNSSLSKTPSGIAAGVYSHQRLRGPRRERVQGLRDHFLARTMLAGDEDVRVGWAHACDRIHDSLHRGSAGDEIRPAFRPQQAILGFQARARCSARCSSTCVRMIEMSRSFSQGF